MTVTIKEPAYGLVVWYGKYDSVAAAISAYRMELGAEALDYDAVNPQWADDLIVETDESFEPDTRIVWEDS